MSDSLYKTRLRTHACGELRGDHADASVTLTGWVDLLRDQGGVVFVTLRDRTGIVQITAHPDKGGLDEGALDALHPEAYVCVEGKVIRRPEGMVNPDMPTGEIEIEATGIKVLSPSSNPPLVTGTRGDREAEKGKEADEERRLQYRYLDLRRPSIQSRLITRHKICSAFRRFFDAREFVDVETPILTLSTPEGARDYLVPSRVWAGHFYALPQSPQIFKQLLMVSGLDRYYQIARCFRDEDQRKDRQLEFTQLDLEMTAVSEDDILDMVEGAIVEACQAAGHEVATPFPRMTYHHAMLHYGSDKPDTRFEMLIQDITEVARASTASFLKAPLEAGGVARIVGVKGGADSYSRKDLDKLTEMAKGRGGGGVAWMKVKADEGAPSERLQSPIAKFFSDEQLQTLMDTAGVGAKGDLMLIVADKDPFTAAGIIGEVRLQAGAKMGLLEGKERQLNFLFCVEFPLFEPDPENPGQVMPTAHPFTGVFPEDAPYLDSEPTRVRGRHYDLVLNGVELGSGSVRIHEAEIQQKIFKILGLSEEEQQRRFGFMLEAFQYGAPPHGGFALGIDRFCQLLAGGSSIRDVIAFPKTNNARCPMTLAPSKVETPQLDELHIGLKGDALKSDEG